MADNLVFISRPHSGKMKNKSTGKMAAGALDGLKRKKRLLKAQGKRIRAKRIESLKCFAPYVSQSSR